MRPLRCPLPRGLYEICTRVTGNGLLMRPSDEVNDIILGVIGRAQTQNDVELHAFVFLSNHYHILLSVPSGAALSKFMQFVNGNIARKLNIINDRDGAFWERRFRAIPVSADESTQVWRLRYLLAHGTKENLVGRVEDWPGASSLPWLRDGKKIRGKWQSLTQLYHARRRKGYVEVPDAFTIVYELKFTALPCWQHLPAAAWRKLVRDIIGELQAAADERRGVTNHPPLGVAAVLAADPFARVHSRHGRAPAALALDRDVRKAMDNELKALYARWRRAARAARELLVRHGAGADLTPPLVWAGLQV
jgi:REP element-mobilizing transposase RayT